MILTNNQPSKSHAFIGVALTAMLGMTFFLSPLLVLVLICFAIVLASDGPFSRVYLFAACLLFVLLNLSKELEGDLATYTNLQLYLQDRSPGVLFSVDELRMISGTYRATEFGFYAPLWFLSNLFPDSRNVIPIAATLAIYIATFIGLEAIAKGEHWNRRLTLVVAFFVFFASINFIQSIHLVRQYVSASLAFCAFAFFVNQRFWLSVSLALAACSVHNGTILVVVNFATAAALLPYRGRVCGGVWYFLFRALMVTSVLAISVATIVFHEIGHMGNEDKNIAAWHYAVAGGLFLVAFFCSRVDMTRTRTSYYLNHAFVLIYAFSLIFFLLGFQTQALRYFAYLEWLFGLLVAAVLCAVPRWRLGLYLTSRFMVCAVAIMVFLARVQDAVWVYGPGGRELFSQNVFGLAEYLGK